MNRTCSRRATQSAVATSVPWAEDSYLTIDGAIGLYLTHRAMKGATDQSLRDLRRYLKNFNDWAKLKTSDALDSLDADLLKEYQGSIFEYRKADGQPLATASKLAKLVPLRGWLRWLSTQGELPLALVDAIELPTPDQALPRQLLSASEIEKVMALPRTDTPRGLRDRAMLELLYATGIRRMEIGHLEITDLDLSHGILRVRKGKGRKDRRVPMGPSARAW